MTKVHLVVIFSGEMKENDSVLIHAGGSGVGTAAVQLVKLAKGKLNINYKPKNTELSSSKQV